MSSEDQAARKRPDQPIYRPGMFKRGYDFTKGAPNLENLPPKGRPSPDADRERSSTHRNGGPQGDRFRQPRPDQRAASVSGGNRSKFPPRDHHRGGGGPGSVSGSFANEQNHRRYNGKQVYHNSKNEQFDAQSVKLGNGYNNRRYNNGYRKRDDTRSEAGRNHNDDTSSIASSTFSTSTVCHNNGFASELNSRQPSIQSLLSQDLPSFDWADLSEELGNLPETEDEQLSERTPGASPRKHSVVSSNKTIVSEGKAEESHDVHDHEAHEGSHDVSQTSDALKEDNSFAFPDGTIITDSSDENNVPPESTTTISNLAEELQDTQPIIEDNVVKPVKADVKLGRFKLVSKALNDLRDLIAELHTTLKSEVPDIDGDQVDQHFVSAAQAFRSQLEYAFDPNTETMENDADTFRRCALDVMKTRQLVASAAALLPKFPNYYILKQVIDIALSALTANAVLIIHSLEHAKRFQLVDTFEQIWLQLVSEIKKNVKLFGRTIATQTITMIRGVILTVSNLAGVESVFGVLSKAVMASNMHDFVNGINVDTENLNLGDDPQLKEFAGAVYRWQGDLARYQEMIIGSTDYDSSIKMYFLSFIIDPNNGTALNQIGAVASYKSSRRRSLARRRFGRRIPALNDKQDPSDLLGAVQLFFRALTTKKPFRGCVTKLSSILASPFENGLEVDPNTDRTIFIQYFLAFAQAVFFGVDSDIEPLADKVALCLKATFENNTEDVVFTNRDFVSQIGILWSLIKADCVKPEHKDSIKHLLHVYGEAVGDKLIKVLRSKDAEKTNEKIAFLAIPLSILAKLWRNIGGPKLPSGLEASEVENAISLFDNTTEPCHVILPELLLILHSDDDYLTDDFLKPTSTLAPAIMASTSVRLATVADFFRAFKS
uniref:EST1_DNA_bind domain-containing protein n=1 Tax=Panagrellus redivivus TaxID=6233 RepID=A0A7E4W1Y3_PANRE